MFDFLFKSRPFLNLLNFLHLTKLPPGHTIIPINTIQRRLIRLIRGGSALSNSLNSPAHRRNLAVLSLFFGSLSISQSESFSYGYIGYIQKISFKSIIGSTTYIDSFIFLNPLNFGPPKKIITLFFYYRFIL